MAVGVAETEIRSQRLLVACAALALLAPVIAAIALPSMAQPASYHNFADQRICGRVSNGFNVWSNVPFFIVGLLGLKLILGSTHAADAWARSRWPYVTLFAGVALTAFGSGYYHLNPSHATLVWDRLPMALGFAGLLAGTLADRRMRSPGVLLAALIVVSVGSVLYWSGTRNLLPYLVMQGAFMSAVLVATVFAASNYTKAGWIFAALAVYALAIVCERLDWEIFEFTRGVISGHTIKHLVAAGAIFVLYIMLRTRRPRGVILHAAVR